MNDKHGGAARSVATIDRRLSGRLELYPGAASPWTALAGIRRKACKAATAEGGPVEALRKQANRTRSWRPFQSPGRGTCAAVLRTLAARQSCLLGRHRGAFRPETPSASTTRKYLRRRDRLRPNLTKGVLALTSPSYLSPKAVTLRSKGWLCFRNALCEFEAWIRRNTRLAAHVNQMC